MNGIPNNLFDSDPTVRRVLDALRSIVRELRLASAATGKHHGLSSAQVFVLHVLGKDGRLSLGELADATFTDQSSVSVVVRKLEEKQLVVKAVAGHDRRRLEISLSPEGRGLLQEAPPPVQDTLVRRMAALQANELLQLAGLLEALAPPSSEPPPMFFEERGRPSRKEAGHGPV
ncbi:MarR family winged helix-turn-helix transcriptional regulator [Geothrix oryzisoli]|uniref:MarR family winged helix-turn-helix transcriptional regulator n=1 Tax=Geothrix oryzisoli TaxID=2922721 RepID=UPI001FADB9CF|nr:MarR family transcriptional regulator [Geothrix oryzisoli]